jgi:S1-C subfamily serine protease
MAVGGDGAEFSEHDPQFPLLPPEDRIWRHPSELAAGWQSPVPARTKERVGHRMMAGLLLVTLVAAGALTADASLSRKLSRLQPSETASTIGLTTPVGPSLVAPAERVAASVVSVVVHRNGRTTRGAGVVMTSDGTIVTTHSLVEGASSVEVIDSRGTHHPAKLAGTDGVVDVAALRIQATGLHAAIPAPPDALQVSDLVVAVAPGRASDGGPVMAIGTVKALGVDRDRTGGQPLLHVLSVDVPQGGGWEGAPLVDSSGRVVALIAGHDTDGSATLATPMSLVQPAAIALVAEGRATHGWLGVQATSAPPGQPGVVVTSVDQSGPAAQAGLDPGDVIIAVGGARVDSMLELKAAVRLHQPDQAVNLTMTRDGVTTIRSVTLGDMVLA